MTAQHQPDGHRRRRLCSLHLQLEQWRNDRGCQQPHRWQLQRHHHRCERLCSTSSSFTLTEPALLVSSGVAATYVCGTNVSCNGANDGSINLTVTGGADCVHSLHLQLEQRRNNRGCQQPDCWQLLSHHHRCEWLQHKQQLHADRTRIACQLWRSRNLCLRNQRQLQRRQ